MQGRSSIKHYLAALIDGEGSITPRKKSGRPKLHIVIRMADKEPLLAFARFAKVPLHGPYRFRSTPKKNRLMYRVQACGDSAVRVACELGSLLKIPWKRALMSELLEAAKERMTPREAGKLSSKGKARLLRKSRRKALNRFHHSRLMRSRLQGGNYGT